MNIYFIMQVNEYNNKSVNSVFVTKEGAEARCRDRVFRLYKKRNAHTAYGDLLLNCHRQYLR
jgi:hypothetical protein